jgi:pyruvate dehydrogenase E2 component (dihydrolipoamide acetyltransferase)
MAVEVFMPRLTHDMHQGILLAWLKEDGDIVQVGDPLFEVETDKAATEVMAEASGTFHQFPFKPGDRIPIGTILGYILRPGEEMPVANEKGQRPIVQTPPAVAVGGKRKDSGKTGELPQILASPIARRLGREHQIDLSLIHGTGPQGRITEADVRAYLKRLSSQPLQVGDLSAKSTGDIIPLTRIQHSAGQRMLNSAQTIPQFTLEVDVDMRAAMDWREAHNRISTVKVGYTAILVRIIAHSLKRHPRLNSSLEGDAIRMHREVNLAVAIAATDGLLAPVIQHADTLDIEQIQELLTRLRSQSNTGHIEAKYLSGGTFTLSNLGMFGVDRFRALINPPQVAILAVGAMRACPAWGYPVMTLCLSADHRALDGATVAPFLIEIRDLLVNPSFLG